MILETTFLVDLERELLGGAEGAAHAFLADHANARLHITATIAGELAAGMSLDRRDSWERFVRPFTVLPCTPDVCWEYGQAFRFLRANGIPVGANDLWIGAAALAFDQPVVTRNVKHFRRIPRLAVLGYGDDA